MPRYAITEKAGRFVAGHRNNGAGTVLTLTEREAAFDERNGALVDLDKRARDARQARQADAAKQEDAPKAQDGKKSKAKGRSKAKAAPDEAGQASETDAAADD